MDAMVKVLPVVLQILGVVVLVELAYIGFKLAAVATDIASISRRVTLLTDITGWFSFFKKFTKK